MTPVEFNKASKKERRKYLDSLSRFEFDMVLSERSKYNIDKIDEAYDCPKIKSDKKRYPCKYGASEVYVTHKTAHRSFATSSTIRSRSTGNFNFYINS